MFSKFESILRTYQSILLAAMLAFAPWCRGGLPDPVKSKASAKLAYCISDIGRYKRVVPLSSDKLPDSYVQSEQSVQFEAGGRRFDISTVYRFELVLRAETGNIVQRIHRGQSGWRYISKLALSDDGWLWIDGSEHDHLAKLDVTRDPPYLNEPVKLSSLKREPCSWFSECKTSQGYYSPTLQSVFVSGFEESVFGNTRAITFQVKSGEWISLDSRIDAAQGISEQPELGGVLFHGRNGEALFFDGKKVTALLQAEKYLNQWVEVSLETRPRLFLTSRVPPSQQAFLVEIIPGPKVREFQLPADALGTIELYTMPGSAQAFGLTVSGLLMEAEGTWHWVARAAESVRLSMYGTRPDGSVLIQAQDSRDKTRSVFSTHLLGRSDRCNLLLDGEEVVILDAR